MGKNHRHKKQVKSERAKTKLKGSKTKLLPKGQNVTNISFKIKPIVLPEQLKQSNVGGELLTKRKLNLKDVLGRLRHHNVPVKVENCQQLRELIDSYSEEVLRQNISQILQGVCPLMLEVESRLRSEAVKVIRAVLIKATLNDVEAIFSILSTYLSCTMTHIDHNIQEDSLSLLDSLIEHMPGLVANNAGHILSNFFSLISRLKSDSKPDRTLTENLKSKHTNVRWRVKVLHRLKGIFEAMYTSSFHSLHRDEAIINAIKMGDDDCRAPLYVNKYHPCTMDFLSDVIFNCTDEPMADYIKTLMPLLYETWLEVAPVNVTDLLKPALKEHTSDTLMCVLDVIYFCWQLAEVSDDKNGNSHVKKAFSSKVTKQLVDKLLRTFPYSRANRNSDCDVQCVRENLLICYIFTILHKTSACQDDNRRVVADSVINYINYCLTKKNHVNGENTKLFLQLLKIILSENIPYCKDTIDTHEFNRNVSFFYQQNKKMLKTDGVDLLFMLRDNSGGVDLARILLEPEVQMTTLDSLLVMVKKNSKDVREGLRKHLASILGNILTINVIGADDRCSCVVKILSLYYYIPLGIDDTNALIQFGRDNPSYYNFIDYVVHGRKSDLR